MQNIISAAPAVSGALQLGAEFAYRMFKVAMTEYRFVKSSSFNKLEDLHELKRGSALHHNVHLVLASLPYSPCSECGKVNHAHNVLEREN